MLFIRPSSLRSKCDFKFIELLLIDSRRSIEHDIASGIVLREGNAVADTVETGKDAHPTVEAVGQTAVRRCTILKGIHQEAKLRLCLFRSESKNLEHLRL